MATTVDPTTTTSTEAHGGSSDQKVMIKWQLDPAFYSSGSNSLASQVAAKQDIFCISLNTTTNNNDHQHDHQHQHQHQHHHCGQMMLLMGGGQDNTNTNTNSNNLNNVSNAVQLLDVRSKRVFSWPNLQQSRFGALAVVCYSNNSSSSSNNNPIRSEQRIYVFGGCSATGQILTSVEALSLPPPVITNKDDDHQQQQWQWKTVVCKANINNNNSNNNNYIQPQMYASGVVLPRKNETSIDIIMIMGGRGSSYQELDSVQVFTMDDDNNKDNDSNDSNNSIICHSQHSMPGRRMGLTSLVLNDTSILVLGGYDGRTWQRTTWLYNFQTATTTMEEKHQNQQQVVAGGEWTTTLPDMLETVRFPKAVLYHKKYVLVAGELDDHVHEERDGIIVIQCYDSHKQEWIWIKPSSCVTTTHTTTTNTTTTTSSTKEQNTPASVEALILQEPFLYILGRQPVLSTFSNNNNNKTSGLLFRCELSKLDSQMVCDVLPVVVGTSAITTAHDNDYFDAPTILATEAVLVVEDDDDQEETSRRRRQQSKNYKHDQNEQNMQDDDHDQDNDEQEQLNIKLRNVVNIKLSEKSFYTGQLRKQNTGSYVPHGQGLLVWIEDKDGGTGSHSGHSASSSSTTTAGAGAGASISPNNSHTTSSSLNSSYYKGQFKNGFRHGLGEMYLKVEDKHYFGCFDHGSWEGMGTLKVRSRGFSYFGGFVAGEITGPGQCSYRVKDTNNQMWKQKTYSGGFLRGLANGRGVITDYLTGKIEEDRIFREEDLFEIGSVAVFGDDYGSRGSRGGVGNHGSDGEEPSTNNNAVVGRRANTSTVGRVVSSASA